MLKLRLRQLIDSFNISNIDKGRKELLEEIGHYIVYQKKEERNAQLVFVGIDNSRASQMLQVWASALAHHYGISGLEFFSGGISQSTINVRVVNALLTAGFDVIDAGAEFPKFMVGITTEKPPLLCFSKRYDHQINPSSQFAAIITSNHENESVLNTEVKFNLFYDGLKDADDTPWEGMEYEDRLRQIGAEMKYLMEFVVGRV